MADLEDRVAVNQATGTQQDMKWRLSVALQQRFPYPSRTNPFFPWSLICGCAVSACERALNRCVETPDQQGRPTAAHLSCHCALTAPVSESGELKQHLMHVL